MKNLIFKTLALSIFCILWKESYAQTSDFTMSYDSTGVCNAVTIEVWAGGVVIWSGAPTFGNVCISGGTPTFIRIIDGTCNQFDVIVNAPMSKSGNLCPGSCLIYTADSPPNYYGFYAGYFSSGGNCANPFVSGLLTLTMYPQP